MPTILPSRFLLLLFALCLPAMPAMAGPAGAVTAQSGASFAVGKLGSRPLHKGRTLFAGDILVTARDGSLMVRLRNGVTIVLAADSRVALAAVAETGAAQAMTTRLHLLRGVVRVLVEGLQAPDRVQLGSAVLRVEMGNGDLVMAQSADGQSTGAYLVEGAPMQALTADSGTPLAPGSGLRNAPGGGLEAWPANARNRALERLQTYR